MIVTKSYSFYSKDLNGVKFKLLKDKAVDLRKFKNHISEEVCSNFIRFTNKSKFEWINHFRTHLKTANNQDISHAISDVFIAYENKLKKFKSKTTIRVQKGVEIKYYKRNGRNFKKGDIKTFKNKMMSTRLTKVMSYLVRYHNDDLVSFLKAHINDDPKKKPLRQDVLFYLNKYGDRLVALSKRVRSSILTDLTRHPIEFKSLSFTSCNEQKARILDWNKTIRTGANAFITISGQKTVGGKINIPVSHSKKHHGNIKDYDKEPNAKSQKIISYTMCFLKGKVRIVLSKKCKEKVIKRKTKYLGVDVNVKHNLFAIGNDTIDYDRDMFNDYVKFIKRMDGKLRLKKSTGEKTILSLKDEYVKSRWLLRIKDMLKRKVNLLVQEAITKGKDHIVMEDLGLMGKSYTRSEDFLGFKYSRLIRLLNLADLKYIASSIAQKKGLQITFIQPHYTSQTCECGSITRLNRPTQEIFNCISCGSSANADTHSSEMIEERLSVDVLRRKLLDFNKGLYSAKKLSKDVIKNILKECYDTRALAIDGSNDPLVVLGCS